MASSSTKLPPLPRDSSETLVLFEPKDLSSDTALDEMNLVELPFALLTRSTEGIYEIMLSKDGNSRLACLKSSKYGLPNGLAYWVVLGLMALWKEKYPEEPQTFSFKLRDLVERYIYPQRDYKPSSVVLRSVERQIHCVANSRIHTDRWYDKRLGRRLDEANIAILSDVKTREKGGKNKPKVLEVSWGQSFWESLCSKYTKGLDVHIVQALQSPLDLQLYRLLDRQLWCDRKRCQHYTDIVDFARYKLGMQGKTLDVGGRTASSYVAKKLSASIRRLSREKFTVRMIIDRSTVPFSVTFERLNRQTTEQQHEVLDQDLPDDLLREFYFFAHNIPRKKRTRSVDADYQSAKEWIDQYGFEQATWMVEHAVRLQKARKSEPILTFRGLALYEAAAAGAYDQHQIEEAGQLRLALEERAERLWDIYQQRLIASFDSEAAPQVLNQLKEEALSLQQQRADVPASLLKLSLDASVRDMKWNHMNGLEKDAFIELFLAHHGSPTFRDTLIDRHGFDVLHKSASTQST